MIKKRLLSLSATKWMIALPDIKCVETFTHYFSMETKGSMEWTPWALWVRELTPLDRTNAFFDCLLSISIAEGKVMDDMQHQFHKAQEQDHHSEATLILSEWLDKINEIEKLMLEINRRQQASGSKAATALPIFQKKIQIGNEKQMAQIKKALGQLVLRLRDVAKTYQSMAVQVVKLQKLLKMNVRKEIALKKKNLEKNEEERLEESQREMYEDEEEKKTEEKQLEAERILEALEAEEIVEEEIQNEAIIERQQAKTESLEEEAALEAREAQVSSRPDHESEYENMPKEVLYKKLEDDIRDLTKMPQEITKVKPE